MIAHGEPAPHWRAPARFRQSMRRASTTLKQCDPVHTSTPPSRSIHFGTVSVGAFLRDGLEIGIEEERQVLETGLARRWP